MWATPQFIDSQRGNNLSTVSRSTSMASVLLSLMHKGFVVNQQHETVLLQIVKDRLSALEDGMIFKSHVCVYVTTDYGILLHYVFDMHITASACFHRYISKAKQIISKWRTVRSWLDMLRRPVTLCSWSHSLMCSQTIQRVHCYPEARFRTD